MYRLTENNRKPWDRIQIGQGSHIGQSFPTGRLDVQELIPLSMRPQILYLAHYPIILSGHPGGRRTYDKLRR